MKLSQIMFGLDIVSAPSDFDPEVTGICYDSRNCTPGQIFVAIRGFEQDGNTYISHAVERGACAIVSDAAPHESVPTVMVPDARVALAQMSASFFGQPQNALKLVGVTGTKGKTTVTTLLKEIIEATGAKCGLIGTNGNMIGGKALANHRTTPESHDLYRLLAQMRDEGCQYAVMEVSSHALILERVWGLHFEVAAFTNLSQDHLDFHKDMEDYFQAKSRLFTRCTTAVLNRDSEEGRRLMEQCTCSRLSYSTKEINAQLVAKNIRQKADRVEFDALTMESISKIKLATPGLFSVYNAMAAIGCALALDIEMPVIEKALAASGGVKGRAEVVPVPADYTVIIDYAHSPDSMENILKTVREFAKGRVIGLFGCGGNRDKSKRPIMARVGAQLCDVAVLTSDNPRNEEPHGILDDMLPGVIGTKSQLHVICDRREAIAFALSIARADDVVILMGKGHETYQEIEGKKHSLDERDVIREYYSKNE